MTLVLQITLALVLVAVGAALVPLLIQMRRTARAAEALAESARQDLRQISQDVHEARLQVDRIATLVEKGLEFPATAGSMATSLLRTVTASLDRGPSLWMDVIVTALKFGLDFIRRPRAAAPDKEKNDE